MRIRFKLPDEIIPALSISAKFVTSIVTVAASIVDAARVINSFAVIVMLSALITEEVLVLKLSPTVAVKLTALIIIEALLLKYSPTVAVKLPVKRLPLLVKFFTVAVKLPAVIMLLWEKVPPALIVKLSRSKALKLVNAPSVLMSKFLKLLKPVKSVKGLNHR